MKKIKIISVFCILAMLFSCFAAFPAFAENAEETKWTWNDGLGVEGKTYLLDDSNFSLFWAMSKSAGNVQGGAVKGNYKLTENVTLNEGNASDWADSAKRPTGNDDYNITKVWNSPIGGTASFAGTFDGQGFTISGICMVSAGSYNFAGLFGTVNGTVEDLRLINSYFESTVETDVDSSGSIAAKLNGTVSNCYSEAILNNTASKTGNKNGSPVGGIVGRAIGTSTIENCVFAGQILDSMGPTGGIFGSNSYGSCSVTVSNCLNLGSVHSTIGNCAPIVGRAYTYNNASGVAINNCLNLSTDLDNTRWADGELIGIGKDCFTVDNYILIKGFRIANNVGVIGNSADTVISSGVYEKSLAELLNTETKLFADWNYKAGYVPNPTTFDLDKLATKNFAVEWTTEDGAGTAGVTYELNQNNFQTFWANTKGKNIVGNYILTSDVTINSGDALDWADSANRTGLTTWNTPIGGTGSFGGTFDGQGHTISGICLVQEGGYHRPGLFAKVTGTVKNLRFENSYIETITVSASETGGITGILQGGTVSNCYVDVILNNTATVASPDETNNKWDVVGGIVGRVNTAATISNCVFAGEIRQSVCGAGGILGANEAAATITDCINLGKISSTKTTNVGGIVGRVYAGITLKNVVNLNTDISSTGTYGQIIGTVNPNNITSKENIVVVDGFKTATDLLYGNCGAMTSHRTTKTFGQLINADEKVFADWNYADGYIPNPTTFEIDKLHIFNFVNAEALGLETQGKIHSIRISPDNPGLRFLTFVDADVIAALKAEGAYVKMKTYITAAKYLQDEIFDFTYDWLNTNKKVLMTEAKGYLFTEEADGYTAFAGSVSGINDLTMEYIARGCLEITMNGKMVLVYADWDESEATCVSRIASLAVNDTSLEYTEDYYKYQITNVAGKSVYSPYTQAQYNSILLLIAEADAVIPDPANGLALTSEEVNALAFSTADFSTQSGIDNNGISVQGGCVDGKGYIYNFYIDTKNHTKTWVVKTNIATGEVVLSKELTETQKVGETDISIYFHANGASYNTRTDEIAIIGYNSNKIHILDPETLTLKRSYALPSGIQICGMTYNAVNNEYYAVKYESDAADISTIYCFDAHFTTCTVMPINYTPTEGYVAQSSYTDGTYYYATEYKIENSDAANLADKGISNNLQIYNVATGERVACINMNLAYETENISFYNGDFYVTCNNGNWTGSMVFKYTVSSSAQA